MIMKFLPDYFDFYSNYWFPQFCCWHFFSKFPSIFVRHLKDWISLDLERKRLNELVKETTSNDIAAVPYISGKRLMYWLDGCLGRGNQFYSTSSSSSPFAHKILLCYKTSIRPIHQPHTGNVWYCCYIIVGDGR